MAKRGYTGRPLSGPAPFLASRGDNIFVAQSILDVPLRSIYDGLVRFIAVAIVGLMILTYVPALSFWLVRFLG